MHNIQINNALYKLPENWNELTTQQLIYLVNLTRSDLPIEQVKTYMLLYCMQAHVCRHKKIYQEYVKIRVDHHSYFLLPEEICTLANLLEFLLKSEESNRELVAPVYRIQPDLTRNPFPTIRCRMNNFIGPDDQLLDITFEQFMYMQTFLDAMQSDPTKIDYLLVCLWHRKQSFDINQLDKDAALLHHLPDAKKMIMYWYVLGSLSYLSDSYPRIFHGDGKTTHNGRVFDAQLRLLDSLAQSDMTKKPEVRKGLLIDALYSMDESIRRQEEMDEKLKNK